MINIDNLVSLYPKTSAGLQGFSGSFVEGCYGLLGKNGSGKTTLFKNLIGALFADSGNISVLGLSPYQRNPELMKDIFIIPEVPFFANINPQTYIKATQLFYSNYQPNIMAELTKAWKLPTRNSLLKMSQGQKKKFLIAFAIACKTKILLLDEPTNGLDIESKLLFRERFSEFISPDQLVIISTHHIKDIENLIDHITFIDEGKHQGSFAITDLNENFTTRVAKSTTATTLFSISQRNEYFILEHKQKKTTSKSNTSKKTTHPLDLELFYTAFQVVPEKITAVLHNQ